MILFKPWRRFIAFRDRTITNRFLMRVADESENVFRRGMLGRHSGRVYQKSGGRSHQASAPGEYPASDSGALLDSIDTRVTHKEATIGTSQFYARFLRNGTRKMARRKMSDNALQEGVQKARPALRGFVRWKRA